MGPNPQVKDIFDADYFEQVIFNENGQMFVYSKQATLAEYIKECRSTTLWLHDKWGRGLFITLIHIYS